MSGKTKKSKKRQVLKGLKTAVREVGAFAGNMGAVAMDAGEGIVDAAKSAGGYWVEKAEEGKSALAVKFARGTEDERQEIALAEVEKGKADAKKTLEDKKQLDRLLRALEKKIKMVPRVGGQLSYAVVFVELLSDYVNKEYTEIPMGSLLAIVSTLLYWLNPLDIVPDVIPGLGKVDDAAVFAICWKLVYDDIQDYLVWRHASGRDEII